jgi:hypothetical protein
VPQPGCVAVDLLGPVPHPLVRPPAAVINPVRSAVCNMVLACAVWYGAVDMQAAKLDVFGTVALTSRL